MNNQVTILKRKKNLIYLPAAFLLIGIGLGLFFKKEDDFHSIILFFIGLGASLLGTLAGGAGLITVPGMMLTGIPIQTSIATNKFSSAIAAISSVFYLIYHGQLKIKSILNILLVAFLGGIGGSLITSHINQDTMNMVALFFLCLALIVTLKNMEWTDTIKFNQNDHTKRQKLLFPFLIAVYDGGFGPGSSTLSIIYYLKNSCTYIKAVQITRVLILGSCTGGFIVFYQNGFIHWSYAMAMAIGSVIGSQIGLIVLPKIPKKFAKTLLIIIICLLIIQMIIKLI